MLQIAHLCCYLYISWEKAGEQINFNLSKVTICSLRPITTIIIIITITTMTIISTISCFQSSSSPPSPSSSTQFSPSEPGSFFGGLLFPDHYHHHRDHHHHHLQLSLALLGGLQLAISTLGLIGNTLSIVLLSRCFVITTMTRIM